MSLEYFVYSAQDTIPDRDAIRKALLKRGWHVLFATGKPSRSSESGILGNGLVYGTTSSGPLTTVKEALKKRAGCCGVAVDLSLVLDEDTSGEEILSAIGTPARGFSIHTSAGRSKLSFKLQQELWCTLATLTDGVLVDPQQAACFRCGSTPSKLLPLRRKAAVSRKAERAVQEEYWDRYYDALQKSGFPVERKSKNVWHHQLVHFTIPELERLLKFASKYHEKDAYARSAEICSVFQRLHRDKPKAFLRENDRELARLERQYPSHSWEAIKALKSQRRKGLS